MCLASVACGLTLGRVVYAFWGGGSLLPRTDGAFLSLFMNSFYSVLLPMILMGTLSVTVYCIPVALGLLFYRSSVDAYAVFCALDLFRGASANVVFLLYTVAVHVFYTYCFYLLALRCVHYRSEAASAPCNANTLLRKGSVSFFGDYTSVCGVVTLCGLFDFSILYFM